MESEEIRVSMSGPTMAFFLYEAASRPTDLEGLLFGDYQRCLHREISDQHDLENQNRPATIIHDVVIRRVIPTGIRFSFYDRRFNPNLPNSVAHMVKNINVETAQALQNDASSISLQSVHTGSDQDDSTIRSGFLGWFRFQRCGIKNSKLESNVSRTLSQREALRHFKPLANTDNSASTDFDLPSYFPWPGNGPFYIYSSDGTKNNILEWGVQLKAYNQSTDEFRPIRLHIRNLGDTTHADYWKLGNGGSAASAERMLPGIGDANMAKSIFEHTNITLVEPTKRQLIQGAKEVMKESQNVMQLWNSMQFQSGHPGEHYAKYGCAPTSKEDFTALLNTLRIMVESGAGASLPVQTESLSNGDASGHTPDLFNSGPTISSGDYASEFNDFVMVNREMDFNSDAPYSLVQSQGQMLSDVDAIRHKRPKEEVSSSSSGTTTGDELAEQVAASISPSLMESNMDPNNSFLPEPLKPQRDTENQINQRSGGNMAKKQQRKKSRNACDDDGLETLDPMSESLWPYLPSSTVPPHPPSHQDSGYLPGSHSGIVYPKMNKGRGRQDDYAKNIAPPPGFDMKK